MVTHIAGTMERKGEKSKFTGIINPEGIVISRTRGEELPHMLSNLGETEKMSPGEAIDVLRGEEQWKLAGVIVEDGKQNKIKGAITEKGILVIVYNDQGKQDYILINQGPTEEFDLCFSCLVKAQ
jgi:hypothetical protein